MPCRRCWHGTGSICRGCPSCLADRSGCWKAGRGPAVGLCRANAAREGRLSGLLWVMGLLQMSMVERCRLQADGSSRAAPLRPSRAGRRTCRARWGRSVPPTCLTGRYKGRRMVRVSWTTPVYISRPENAIRRDERPFSSGVDLAESCGLRHSGILAGIDHPCRCRAGSKLWEGAAASFT